MANEGLDFYLDGVANFTVCVIGLAVNAAAIGMLCRQKTSSIFVKLMISLVTYDLIYVFLFATCYSLPRLSDSFREHVFVHVAPFLVPITQMALSGSVYTTVGLTLERYISVVVPFFRQRNNLKAWVFIIPVAIFVITYSIPRFFEVKTEFVSVDRCVEHLVASNGSTIVDAAAPNDAGDDILSSSVLVVDNQQQSMIRTNTCTTEWVAKIKVTELRFNPYYVSIYALYLNMIVNICLPLALLVAMNICIYRTMRNQWYRPPTASAHTGHHHQQQQQQQQQAGTQQRPATSFMRHLFCRRRSSAGSDIQHHAIAIANSGIRRVGGLSEAEFKKRDAKYTRASVVMVVAFVVCNTPRFVPNIMEIFIGEEHFPQWGFTLISINQLLTVINSSFNFLIYWSFCGGHRRSKAVRMRRQKFMEWSSTMKRSRDGEGTSVCRTPSPSVANLSPRHSHSHNQRGGGIGDAGNSLRKILARGGRQSQMERSELGIELESTTMS